MIVKVELRAEPPEKIAAQKPNAVLSELISNETVHAYVDAQRAEEHARKVVAKVKTGWSA